ncbi:putative hemin transport protein [Roseibium hamelinense]|uniref:Putative hemin transport protein n=1 Tax=Roseibium hamelinense TaxID=150831 RepID=A0A562T916_9HYPH|nr:ChuX/HutX family heme-like substrate-binding protein [Roseibium hamelinense]MTI45534.1 hemin-degrading factor [Roseibium hamelinense]TWI90091.1 putative hemin transport protein [Roseibium hamelinense]
MTQSEPELEHTISPAHIRRLRAENPKMRERDLARTLGISEAEVLASFCGHGVRRIKPDFDVLFPGLQQAGEVMALTRNESAVHEKIGLFEKFIPGKHAALMLGENIDTRMFPSKWAHGFAVEKRDGDTVRHSLQFFDAHGVAVQKIHTRPATDLNRWSALVDDLTVKDQSECIPGGVTAPPPGPARPDALELQNELRERWEGMTDPHQFHGLLRDLGLDRLSAFSMAGENWAWKLDAGSVTAMLNHAASEDLPIMCFVGNRGCIQIHSGPIASLFERGPWFNIMDPTFHLHLRTDHICDVWAVRKPADTGHVTSLEAYDREGNQVIQFFGVRSEGNAERSDWRALVEKLPRLETPTVLGAVQ